MSEQYSDYWYTTEICGMKTWVYDPRDEFNQKFVHVQYTTEQLEEMAVVEVKEMKVEEDYFKKGGRAFAQCIVRFPELVEAFTSLNPKSLRDQTSHRGIFESIKEQYEEQFTYYDSVSQSYSYGNARKPESRKAKQDEAVQVVTECMERFPQITLQKAIGRAGGHLQSYQEEHSQRMKSVLLQPENYTWEEPAASEINALKEEEKRLRGLLDEAAKKRHTIMREQMNQTISQVEMPDDLREVINKSGLNLSTSSRFMMMR
jgi:hypothetical protein